MKKTKYDFSGYATRFDLKCSDGRVIRKEAFAHNDGQTVPLVWQHIYNEPTNVLGHGVLEKRDDGMYVYGVFNDTENGKNAKLLVQHGDITALSIFANKLKQQGENVIHGDLKEVSLVLSGANPGAYIDYLEIKHSDGTYDVSDSEAIIYSGEETIEHSSEINDRKGVDTMADTELGHAEEGATVGDIFNSMDEEQKNVLYYMVAKAMEIESDVKHSSEGGENMKKNIFDQQEEVANGPTLSHSQIKSIFEGAQKFGSLKESFLAHVQEYGIENIDYLFPDARTITNTPDLIKRDTEWVAGVLADTHHSPFSRIKSVAADLTADEARAKGYVKGALKKEEVIRLLKRVTTPTTVYKKQKLDRDDIIDITDLDVVAWLKGEMRLMLNEELARAFLIGDGRDSESEDKINEENIRPIYTDDDMYSHHVAIAEDKTIAEGMEAIIRAMEEYEGRGNPTFYAAQGVVTDMLLLKDTLGRRLYNSESEVAAALGVSKIVKVPVMKNVSRDVEAVTHNLLGIIVNLKDYTVGADKGGNISMFDDFDIDYNQYKYLMETRCSAALTHPKSALVIEKIATTVAG